MRLFILVFLLIIGLQIFAVYGCSGQEGMSSSASLKNIAIGKPYTLDPQPNYPLTADPDDKTQLTDGRYTSGYFWTQKTTVGWTGKHPIITIDLGAVSAIKGVSYNTAAGAADVEWPTVICILVSDDGKNFYEAGELVSLSQKNIPRWIDADGYQVHRYWTDALCTHGRYVKLVICGNPYVFVDEIEVYAGDDAWGKIPFKGPVVTDLKALISQKLVSNRVRARLESDIHSIRSILASKPGAVKIDSAIPTQLVSLEEDLEKFDSKQGEDFKAIIPLNPLHERIFNLQAQIWKNFGLSELTVWQNGLWDPLEPIHIPVTGSTPSVQVSMMLNEYRAGAFYISNASDKDIGLHLEIVGLPGGSNPSYITVHEVVWSGTSGGYCYPAALPEAKKSDDAFLISAPSGLTRQVWFTLHPTNISAGLYHGMIVVSGGTQKIEVPLTLNIYPFHFPEQPTLHLGGWDYTDTDNFSGVTPENRDKIIRHLREHFVDSPWGTAAVLPFPDSGDKGITQPDTSRFDVWLQRWRGARQYCVFLDVKKQLSGSPMGTPEFVEKVKQWITFWANHAKLQGVKPEQLNLLLVDEPHTPEQDEIILQWSNAIHAVGAGVKIWEDPTHKDILKANQEMLAGCDVLCPNRWLILNASSELRDYFIKRQKQGLDLSLYSCKGPARELDPYSYYRLQPWVCWELGAHASYFWSFTDTGGASSWNEYKLSGDAYTPLFIDDASVTAGKQIEAIREGLEDYEYLVMLQDRIADLTKRKPESDILDHARKLLVDAPGQVIHSTGANSRQWSKQKDRNPADEMRLKILEMLTEIQKIAGQNL